MKKTIDPHKREQIITELLLDFGFLIILLLECYNLEVTLDVKTGSLKVSLLDETEHRPQ